MAVTKIDINLDSIKVLTKFLDEMEERVTDFSVPLTTFAKLAYKDIQDAISRGGWDGDMWAPHADSTTDRHGAHPLMRNTDGIAEDLAYFVRPTMAGAFTRDPTVILHEHGRGAGWRAIKTGSKNLRGGALSNRKRKQAAHKLTSLLNQMGMGMEMPARVVMGFDTDTIDLGVDLCLDYAMQQKGS
jgi:hypothetical protein